MLNIVLLLKQADPAKPTQPNECILNDVTKSVAWNMECVRKKIEFN